MKCGEKNLPTKKKTCIRKTSGSMSRKTIKISKKCQKMQFSRYANYYNEHQENNLKQYNMNV